RQDRNAGDRQQHRAKSAVIQRGPSDGGRRGELSDHDRELSGPLRRVAPPPHKWGGGSLSGTFGVTSPPMGTAQPLRRLRRHLPINGDGAAPPAPSASPPHEWGRRSPSGAFGATSP